MGKGYEGQRPKWKYVMICFKLLIRKLNTTKEMCVSVDTHCIGILHPTSRPTSHLANRQFRIRQAQTAN